MPRLHSKEQKKDPCPQDFSRDPQLRHSVFHGTSVSKAIHKLAYSVSELFSSERQAKQKASKQDLDFDVMNLLPDPDGRLPPHAMWRDGETGASGNLHEVDHIALCGTHNKAEHELSQHESSKPREQLRV